MTQCCEGIIILLLTAWKVVMNSSSHWAGSVSQGNHRPHFLGGHSVSRSAGPHGLVAEGPTAPRGAETPWVMCY